MCIIVWLGIMRYVTEPYMRSQRVVASEILATSQLYVTGAYVVIIDNAFSLEILLPFLGDGGLPLPRHRSALE